ncbi:unnamed protein product [Lepeophtheirus salmonis]|uniref:(salmon louse) hypothetical protein n=1 Tax=Lepeophtheirus salmonis TaxID=72036 RepID=A0A7R8CCU1_LEPSM|nr:unnamed protein product [Lepeophtheirus salmonis]CAF2772971.1 unnamed protein product [Lepeophtheirus salmonis]
MSEYSMVNTSSLKLKGVSDSGKIKKKSKKKKKSKDLQPSSSKGDIEPQDPQEGETDEVPSTSYYKGKTKSELQFLKKKEKLNFVDLGVFLSDELSKQVVMSSMGWIRVHNKASSSNIIILCYYVEVLGAGCGLWMRVINNDALSAR